MSLVLIIREEILCLFILFFILGSSRIYKMGKDRGSFLRICIFAIGHVVFDLITVVTVNMIDVVPPYINRICHIIFYIFALLYTYEFFCYVEELCHGKEKVSHIRRIGLAPLALYVITLPWLPMEYLTGKGTNYSFGPAAIIGYGVAICFFISSIYVVLKYRKKLEKHVVAALLPMLIAAIAVELIQIIVPETLFTGGAITIITLGFFFSLENPIAVLRRKVLYDALTGVKSRQSYETDIEQMEKKFSDGVVFGMVFCDINGLKAINDTRGHLEGDNYIGLVAQTLMNALAGADAVYRMGGDEFLAVYSGDSTMCIPEETENVHEECMKLSDTMGYEISVSLGYAVSSPEYKSLKDVLRTADYQMYSNKARMKKQRTFLLNGDESTNIAGLTDRIFDALSTAEDNRFMFVTNISTDVTRWSRSAVEYFGLPSEFIYQGSKYLAERIHPQDRDSFLLETQSIITAPRIRHDMQFRIINASGNYVECSCTGTVLPGKNGDPNLFAGTMEVVKSGESIDRITNLRNGFEMMNYFNYLLSTHACAALLKISILNLNSINMLYGYASGDDVLRQFSTAMRHIIGAEGGVFRADGNKFVICVPGMSRMEINEVYQQIRRAAEQRIHIDALKPPIQVAGGAYILTEDFDGDSSILRSNLIYAHTQSKYSQRGRLVFYDDGVSYQRENISRNKLMLSIHQDAITACDGFFLVYQPIILADTSKIIGAEALLRWRNDSYGLVSPDSFIPWLEGDPCFFRLGNWILRKAILDAKKLLPMLPDFCVNINIAMPQLEHEQFRDSVLEILDETGFPPKQLCLELTERCRELDVDFLKGEIEFFRSHGIRVALDDLGTGFSSFGLLLSLNVDEIKLDHTFVKEVQTKRVNQILTHMLVDASNSMGYDTCLEGVEDEELCEYLKSFGATYYQGYYCAKPLPLEELIEHTKNWNSGRMSAFSYLR